MLIDFGAAGDEKFQRGAGGVQFQEVFDEAQVDGGDLADFGQFKLVGAVGELHFTAANPGLAKAFGEFLLQFSGVAAEDDVDAAGQGFAEAFKGFSSHDDDVAQGLLFEPLEIRGQMPGDFVSGADHPVEGHRGDGLEVFHLMILARAGWLGRFKLMV